MRARTPRVTGLGVLMGTLSYMSPEQARGEPLTTASDMYSYGLLLQEMFTNRPVYATGLGPEEQLAKARAGDTLPAGGLGSDLTTLINRLKALAPAIRPSALDTAERLLFIREAPRRRLRRRLGVAALVVATTVARSHTRADAAGGRHGSGPPVPRPLLRGVEPCGARPRSHLPCGGVAPPARSGPGCGGARDHESTAQPGFRVPSLRSYAHVEASGQRIWSVH